MTQCDKSEGKLTAVTGPLCWYFGLADTKHWKVFTSYNLTESKGQEMLVWDPKRSTALTPSRDKQDEEEREEFHEEYLHVGCCVPTKMKSPLG